MTLPTLYIPVGAPGCGKSTLGGMLVDGGLVPPGCVISPDSLRENLLGDASDQSHGNLIFKTAYASVECALTAGRSVYFDATNTSVKSINRLIKRLDSVDFMVHVIFFNTHLASCLSYNSLRDRQVPKDVIERMHGQAYITWQMRENINTQGRLITIDPTHRTIWDEMSEIELSK